MNFGDVEVVRFEMVPSFDRVPTDGVTTLGISITYFQNCVRQKTKPNIIVQLFLLYIPIVIGDYGIDYGFLGMGEELTKQRNVYSVDQFEEQHSAENVKK